MSYIVCGWYTPDYEAWVGPLIASLENVGAPHDFVRVEKTAGGWERNTLRKASMIMRSVRSHRKSTIIFLDVDAIVHEPLDELGAIQTDIGLHMRGKLSRTGRLRVGMRSGTMVLRPTSATLAFLTLWDGLSEDAPKGTVDQKLLGLAVARTPGLTVTNLPIRFCATAGDKVARPVIAHDSASAMGRRMPKLLRKVSHALRIDG